VEGDSASAAFVALISGIAETPVKQNIAITGSINFLVDKRLTEMSKKLKADDKGDEKKEKKEENDDSGRRKPRRR
jgi:hypothetical protein